MPNSYKSFSVLITHLEIRSHCTYFFPFFFISVLLRWMIFRLYATGLPKQPAIAKSVSMHERCSNLRVYTAYMMARFKTTAKYGLDPTVHGLNKGSVVMSGHAENKEVLSWTKWEQHTSLSGNLSLFFFFLWIFSAINLNIPPKNEFPLQQASSRRIIINKYVTCKTFTSMHFNSHICFY